jgi:hypothetical protein
LPYRCVSLYLAYYLLFFLNIRPIFLGPKQKFSFIFVFLNLHLHTMEFLSTGFQNFIKRKHLKDVIQFCNESTHGLTCKLTPVCTF